MKYLSIYLVILMLDFNWSLAPADAKIVEKSVQYTTQGVTMKGTLIYDDAIKDKRPGVLVVHEWWGANEYSKSRARMLAKLGYRALAVDMYGDGKQASTPEEATALSSAVMKDFEAGKKRFLAAYDFLKSQPNVDPEQIAAVGYCFGGGVVLNMARQGADLKGVVSFHGNLAPIQPAQKGGVKAKLLVLHGADDHFISSEQIRAFHQEMTDAQVDYKFVDYPGAVHAFSNPEATALGKKFNIPIAYNESADKKSWKEMETFLKTIFH
jgi:dienelactone hydrolase